MLQSIGSSDLLKSLKGASAHTPTLRGNSEHMQIWSCSTTLYKHICASPTVHSPVSRNHEICIQSRNDFW